MRDIYIVSILNTNDGKIEPIYSGNKIDVANKLATDIRSDLDRLDEKTILNYNISIKMVPDLSSELKRIVENLQDKEGKIIENTVKRSKKNKMVAVDVRPS